MNTTLPGKIISYDGKTAVVTPSMDMQLTSGKTLKPPQIISVPVYWLTADAGAAQITVPLKPGDAVVLHFSQRSIENWLSGSDQAPDDPRRFDLTDCFCTPVMRPTVARADTDSVNVQYGDGTIKIDSGGNLTIDVKSTVHNSPPVTINASDSVTVNSPSSTFNGDVTVNGMLTYTAGLTGSGGGGASIAGGVSITGGSVTHNGTNIGDDHKHSGVKSGGSNTGGPV